MLSWMNKIEVWVHNFWKGILDRVREQYNFGANVLSDAECPIPCFWEGFRDLVWKRKKAKKGGALKPHFGQGIKTDLIRIGRRLSYFDPVE